MLAIAGAADTFTVVFRSTIVQAVTTDELRGRLTATEYVVGIGGESLGRLESGALGSLTSPVISALSGGLATVVLAGVIGLALPRFARYRAAAERGRTQPRRRRQQRRARAGRRPQRARSGTNRPSRRT